MRAAKANVPEDSISGSIRRSVAAAVENGNILSLSVEAEKIAAENPASHLSRRQIADELMMAAGAAGVAIEIGGRRRRV